MTERIIFACALVGCVLALISAVAKGAPVPLERYVLAQLLVAAWVVAWFLQVSRS